MAVDIAFAIKGIMMTAVFINAKPAIQNVKLAMAQIITIVTAVKARIIENFLLMNVCVNKGITMTDLSNALNAIIRGKSKLILCKIAEFARDLQKQNVILVILQI